jgi:hypothetical protein
MSIATKTRIVSFDQVVEILEESDIQKSHDLGHMIMHDVVHPKMGQITVMSAASGKCAVISAS